MTYKRLTSVFVALVSALFLNISMAEGKIADVPYSDSPEIQEENRKMLEEMEDYLFNDNGIMEQVSDVLLKNGYKTRTALAFYSKENIQLKFILVDKEATEAEQEKVKSIFFELVDKNNLDPNAFTIKVGDENDGPDW
ncbi:hypothetical protein [Ureibacillus chungkukjangi]|uniref:Uncharacterized protein n=1 Tax=Ureibacillus chungkukjangi TaxID=1202712 RepID=A0A318TNA2_9BACL|nr:hypothetical protein [Ureibacillus chungkukjangi]MCM3389583.1 hypothetical protein [Ureibacillus chungkukjangi]PYF06342.1 hypothetical protein BJ095_11044 [Ureibacillus chungkukjangi]